MTGKEVYRQKVINATYTHTFVVPKISTFFFFSLKKKIDKIFKVLSSIEQDGFYYNYVNPSSGQWCNSKLKS